ncbi:hypothetical protein RN001_011809 [Aquatica leii]|uniref:BESS domain-containing protein n=1 Tax=Aquatica leii TaxID=1421715 RepID=A0AAN7SD07_9COLE|nr:hypothetical protein RN001_011809 [Aquatica leii]
MEASATEYEEKTPIVKNEKQTVHEIKLKTTSSEKEEVVPTTSEEAVEDDVAPTMSREDDSGAGRHTIDENNETQESTTTQDSQPPSAYLTPSRGKKLKKKREDELLELAAKRLRDKPDECENWALSCAADLKKMEPMQQLFAKNAIAGILMEGQFGLLHRNSVKINELTPTPPSYYSTPTPIYYSSTPSPQYLEQNINQEQNVETSVTEYLSSFQNQ